MSYLECNYECALACVYVQAYAVVSGCARPCTELHGCAKLCMGMHRCEQVCLGMCGHGGRAQTTWTARGRGVKNFEKLSTLKM